MSLITRFLTGFRETDQMEPGLIQKPDGTVWLVNPDGSETQISGGGGTATPPFEVPAAGTTVIVDKEPPGTPVQSYDGDAGTMDFSVAVAFADDVGFYGAPVTDQPIVVLTSPTVQDVIDALVTLGLVAQSD